jgi:hypothetical protein
VLDKASMTVKSQPVVIATADGNDAVISSGLMPGMLVVAAGVHVLQPGQKVTIYKDKSAPIPESRSTEVAGSVAPGAAASQAK